MNTTVRLPLATALVGLGLLTAACAAGDQADPAAGPDAAPADQAADDAAPPAMGMCAPGVTDCVDTVVVPEGDGEPIDEEGITVGEPNGDTGRADPEIDPEFVEDAS